MQFKPKFIAPQSPIKSPDLTAPIGNSCRKIKKGESGFMSKQRSNFLDVDTQGNTEFPAFVSDSSKIKNLKNKFLNKGRIASAKITPPVEKFEVKVKNGEIISMRQITKADGSRIASKFGGRYIPKKDLKNYSLKVLGIDADGIFEV